MKTENLIHILINYIIVINIINATEITLIMIRVYVPIQ